VKWAVDALAAHALERGRHRLPELTSRGIGPQSALGTLRLTKIPAGK
jgi:hypothetical protein